MSIWLLQGNARHIPLANASVQAIVTSPPYFGQRNYGTNAQTWGGDPNCAHEWNTERYYREGGNSGSSSLAFSAPGPQNAARLKEARWRENCTCPKCGAWSGELGNEPTPDLFVAHLVEVFRECWRVLKDDGLLWLNLGDSFCASATGRFNGGSKLFAGRDMSGHASSSSDKSKIPGLKPKDLIGVPWRTAFALQKDGWYLRCAAPWVKRASMPESITDRPSSSLEYIFLLSKSERYFYDIEAVRKPAQDWGQRTRPPDGARQRDDFAGGVFRPHKGLADSDFSERGRNRRNSDWWFESVGMLINEEGMPLGFDVTTRPYPGAHFATFPPDLVEPMILAGSRPSDVILDPFCGTGTVGAVCEKWGRRFVGVELKWDYIGLARDRFRQGRLFEATA